MYTVLFVPFNNYILCQKSRVFAALWIRPASLCVSAHHKNQGQFGRSKEGVIMEE
jgi:hypothetical protein